jgi:hypothetical protein
MIYPKMGGARSYNVTVPKLSGGINTSESPHLIDDNQLTDSLNMWWEKGALRTRDGLYTDNKYNLIPQDIDLYEGEIAPNGVTDGTVENAVTTGLIALPDISDVMLTTVKDAHEDLTIAFYAGLPTPVFIERRTGAGILTADVPATAKMVRISVKADGITTENFFSYYPYLSAGGDDEAYRTRRMRFKPGMYAARPNHVISVYRTEIAPCGDNIFFDAHLLDYDVAEGYGVYDIVISAADKNGSFSDLMTLFDGPGEIMYVDVNAAGDSALSKYGAIAFCDYGVYGVAPGALEDLSDEIYIPTISINGVPSETTDGKPSGDVNEEKNMLTPKFKCTFTTDGVGKYYFLPLKSLDDADVIVTRTTAFGNTYTLTILEGQTKSELVGTVYANVDRNGGYVWFTNSSNEIIPLAQTGERNNVTVTASKATYGDMSKICGMTFNTWYGGDASGLHGGTRLFVSGNPGYPNLVHWSDVNNPLYFPEGNYKYIGGESQKVTAFGKQSDMLVIFKERETYRLGFQSAEVTTQAVEAGTAVTNDYVFTVSPINAYIGCDVPNTIQLCANRLVWANLNGKVYTLVSANQYNEQTIREVSQNIESKIREHTKTEIVNASAADYDGRYYLLIGNSVYVMDYRNSVFVYYGSYADDKKAQRGMEWYKWDVAIEGVTWNRIIGEGTQPVLCGSYGTEEGVTLVNYVFSPIAEYSDIKPDGSKKPVPCMFQTKVFDFGNPSAYKNISQLYLGVGRESTNPVMRFTYLTDRGQAVDAYTLYPLKQPADSGTAEYIDIRRITPRLNRILRFGIKVESDTAMSVDSMKLEYSPYGGVK